MNRLNRIRVAVLEAVVFAKPPIERGPHAPRVRMDWKARINGLSNKEFLRRYKVGAHWPTTLLVFWIHTGACVFAPRWALHSHHQYVWMGPRPIGDETEVQRAL